MPACMVGGSTAVQADQHLCTDRPGLGVPPSSPHLGGSSRCCSPLLVGLVGPVPSSTSITLQIVACRQNANPQRGLVDIRGLSLSIAFFLKTTNVNSELLNPPRNSSSFFPPGCPLSCPQLSFLFLFSTWFRCLILSALSLCPPPPFSGELQAPAAPGGEVQGAIYPCAEHNLSKVVEMTKSKCIQR